ncbi:MAG: translation initiation factor IF-2 [Bdellovibrionaceae bacterium]|nr:translation initiation factor IF-2 [Pseudobdellovibrionaceae bacterium]
MTNQKVFEFAKEIGVETLVLMDKIKKWGLPIKNHMADITPEQMVDIKSKLTEEASSSSAAKKKTTTKKKAPAAADAPVVEKAKAAKAVEAPAKVAKKVSVRKTPNDGANEKPEKIEAPVKKTASALAAAEALSPVKTKRTVIRRKKEDLDAEAEALAAEAAEAEELLEAEVAAAAAEVVVEPAAVEPTPENLMAVLAATAATEEVVPVAAAPAPVASAPAAADDKTATGVASTRKREVLMTNDGPVSGVRSTKRNIVGRMDLNRVSQLPQARAANKSAPNRSIRTGFVAQEAFEPPPVVVEDDDRKDKKGGKKVVGPAAATKEKEQAPPTFVSADFMKREIVFQPKKKKVQEGPSKKTQITTPSAHKRVVSVFGTMSVSDLAQAMGVKANAVIKVLIGNGVMANMNTVLDFDTISLVVPEFKHEAENIKLTDQEMINAATNSAADTERTPRSPVVTVMGHVDHGKTTLLDSIRKARVAAGEAGGITQHIGAYRVKTTLGDVTFIDTPGHEAFTAMRARGANATDIVILVVAADDGVMPQTIEALNHAKAAKVPMIVAVNKMDKPGANPDRIKQQLAEHELVPEDWGGNTQFCPVAAIKGEGVTELLEQISVLAEVLELRANKDRSATGIVIESRVDKGRGNVATLLVQDGTLKAGQAIVIGTIATRVRSLTDDAGKVLKEAGPSMPVEVIGLPGVANAGDRFDVCVDEKSAMEIAEARKQELTKTSDRAFNLEDVFAKIKAGDVKELPIILKCDVAGSVEAVKGLFAKISTAEVKVRVIHSGIGAISESDVLLASTAKGIVVGFNVRPDTGAQIAARSRGIDIKTYSIVYELVDDMKKALGGLLAPIVREKVLGRVQVRETFSVPKIGTIAGCFVTDGLINRNSMLRLLRDGKVVYQGKISSLKRFKDDAKEVQTGFECGISIENYNDIKVGDEIEAFTEETIAREI